MLKSIACTRFLRRLTFKYFPASLELRLTSLCPGDLICAFHQQDPLRLERETVGDRVGIKEVLQPKVNESTENLLVTISSKDAYLQLSALVQL